jgi:vacuolar-type H+-ATPase subunit I/STV1
MATTIIVTVVITVVSVSILGYFIWSGVKAKEMRKAIKDLISKNKNLNESINEISKRSEEIMNYSIENLENYQNDMENKGEKFIRDLDQRFNNFDNNINIDSNVLRKEIEKRFNTVYEKIAESNNNKKV